MAYATAADMLFYGAQMLATIASPDDEHVIDSKLMAATLNGDDRSGWSAEDIANADAAAVRIATAVESGGAKIDQALMAAGYDVPHTGTQVRLLQTHNLYLARFELDDAAVAEETRSPVWTRYQEARKFLAALAAGDIRLGAEPTPANRVQHISAGRVFTRKSLKGW